MIKQSILIGRIYRHDSIKNVYIYTDPLAFEFCLRRKGHISYCVCVEIITKKNSYLSSSSSSSSSL